MVEPSRAAAVEEVEQVGGGVPCIVSEEMDVVSHIVWTASGNKMHPIQFAYIRRVNTEMVLNHVHNDTSRVCA